jgi:hypothetical protein
MSATSFDPVLDELIWGARAIAKAANILKDDGSVNDKKANRLIVNGALSAHKRGGRWVSTRRQILGAAIQSEK